VNQPRINKIFKMVIPLSIIIALLCSNQSSYALVLQENLIVPIHQNSNLASKINSLAHNSKTGEIIFSIQPSFPNQPNFVNFSPISLLTQGVAKFGELSETTINKIKIGPSGNVTVLAGKNGDLVIMLGTKTNKLSLKQEITALAINQDETKIAVGSLDGKLSIFDISKLGEDGQLQVFESQPFKKRIISLVFFNPQRLAISGENEKILILDSHTGKTVKTLQIIDKKLKLFKTLKLKNCNQQRVNDLSVISSMNLIISAHGWEYCQDRKLRIWNIKTGKIIKEFDNFHHPIQKMAWISLLNQVVLVDFKNNLWRISLNEFKLWPLVKLEHSFSRKSNIRGIDLNKMGRINSIVPIEDSPYLLIATGSYFSTGSGLLAIKLNSKNLDHIFHLTLNLSKNLQIEKTETVIMPFISKKFKDNFLDFYKTRFKRRQ
jgi:WD40 repeat protein